MRIAKLQDRSTLEENRIRWFGHVMRMGEERLPKMILKIKLKGKKAVGRPRMKWEDQVKRNVERRGKPWQEVIREKSLGRSR